MKVTKQKRSFFDVLFFRPAKETVEYYNPLNIREGTVVNIAGDDELQGKSLIVASVEEYTREIGDEKFVTTYYTLTYANVGEARQYVRLVCNPIKGATKEDAYKYTLLLLRKTFEEGWSEEMQQAIDDACTNGVWVDEDDGLDEDGVTQISEPYRAEYVRCNDLRSYYQAEAQNVVDSDEDGKFERSEMTSRDVMYLDFERQVSPVDGVNETEFYFIEKDANNGWMTFWVGKEIDPSRVTSL